MKKLFNNYLRIYEEDNEFMPEVDAATTRGVKLFAHALVLGVVAFMVVFIFWAQMAKLDEVTRGMGKVVPSGQVQVIQNLEGGIVDRLLVREGQIVEKGEVLIRIDNSLAEASLSEARAREYRLQAQVTRMEAEIAGKVPEFSKDILENAADAVRNQQEVYQARQNQLQSQIGILQNQREQRQQELSEMRSRYSSVRDSLNLAREQVNILKPLVEQGVSPRLDLLNAQREVSDLEGQLQAVRSGIPRAQSAIAEAEQRINEKREAFKTESSTELNQVRGELESVRNTLTAQEDRVKRTEVKSPVRGTVNKLFVTTIGGVIKPGEDLVSVVPLEDSLLVEAMVRPSDIAFIRPGQDAIVKISAYDFSIYGGLKAKLEDISADTITNEQGEAFYRIRLRTKESALQRGKEILPIIPGMQASVDILTGQKSVLDYLLKPIMKAKSNALTER